MAELKPSDLSNVMAKACLPRHLAKEEADRMDDTMKQCILGLYRSAVHVGEEWQPDLSKIRKPGIVFWGERDSSCPVRFAAELGNDAKANQVLTFDSEHWVIVERGQEVAEALEASWYAVKP